MGPQNIRPGILQRVLTDYRVPFFDLLAARFQGGLSVAAGNALPGEQIVAGTTELAKFFPLTNIHLGRGRFYLCYQKGTIEWLEMWQPGVIIIEANPRYLSTGAVIRWMHQRNLPVIGWGLGSKPGKGFQAAWRKRFIQQFDALLSYSQAGKEQYVSAGFNPEKIFVAPNAASRRPPGDPPIRAAEFVDGRGEVIFVGRLQARKRVDLLLRACASLPARLQPRLTIVGDGPERNALQHMAADIYQRAEFTGDQRGSDLQALFARADVFVLPGTGGLALQQALGFALPAIAAEGDGTQADLVRPENGWLVEPGSQDSLQMALEEALSSPSSLREKGSASFRIVRDEINLERMVDGFVDAIQFVNPGNGK